jgi:pyruvate/2-oxoglutarate/acetoin dehydrogenase E1 component
MTRDLDAPLVVDGSVVRSATQEHSFQTVGRHLLKGQSKDMELFTLRSLDPLDIKSVYRSIEEFVTKPPLGE